MLAQLTARVVQAAFSLPEHIGVTWRQRLPYQDAMLDSLHHVTHHVLLQDASNSS